MGARSDINTHLLSFARPPGPRFRRPRLDTVATSATADLMEDVMGLAVRAMILRRVTRNVKDRAASDHSRRGYYAKCRKCPMIRGKMSSGWGWGCPSVPQKIPTPRESRLDLRSILLQQRVVILFQRNSRNLFHHFSASLLWLVVGIGL